MFKTNMCYYLRKGESCVALNEDALLIVSAQHENSQRQNRSAKSQYLSTQLFFAFLRPTRLGMAATPGEYPVSSKMAIHMSIN